MKQHLRRPRSVPRLALLLAGAVTVTVTGAGCGASGTTEPDPGVAPFEIGVALDAATRYQTMQGFGASVAFEIGLLSNHPKRDELYRVLFPELGIQILRVANWYRNSQAPGNPDDMSDFDGTAAVVAGARAALGRDPLVLMSSWSPPPSIKSIASFVGGTLGQTGGGFRYDDFGRWWRSSLDAHAAAGVVPSFISLQNEPDFVPNGRTTWSACLFDPSESLTANAGYGPALDAVATAIADLDPRPMLIGPEVSGIGGTRVQDYLAALTDEGRIDRLGGIAHHLYNGGSAALPLSFTGGMTAIANEAMGKPIFQTEFGPNPVDMFNVAWLIQNAVTIEGVSAYLHWDLIWGESLSATSPQGLVSLQGGNYRINDAYYAVRHFAKWIDTGWQRIAATAASSVVRASAFTSPDGQSVTVVLLNTDSTPHDVSIDPGAFTFATSAIYRTSGTGERTAELGPLTNGTTVDMPARSLATVTLTP